MKCEKAQELFSDYLEEMLERPMAVAFDQHLKDCPACEREFSAFKMTWQMLETLPEVSPPPGFASEVMMKIRMQREEERRSRSNWQTILQEMFASKVPVRVFAGAVSVFLFAQVVLHTPLRTTIAAWLVPNPMVVRVAQDQRGSLPEGWTSSTPAEAWMQSGLRFELEPSGSNVFRLMIKPESVTNEKVRVYLMSPGCVQFDKESISEASPVFKGTIGGNGQVIPFVLGRENGDQEVMTALIQWQHRGREFLEAAFIPVHLNSMGTAMTSDVTFNNVDLYSALQEVSAKYGVVILANADIDTRLSGINITSGTADDVLYKICADANLRWRPLSSQVYIVERKVK